MKEDIVVELQETSIRILYGLLVFVGERGESGLDARQVGAKEELYV